MKKLIIMALTGAFLFTGCFPSGEVKQNSDSEIKTDERISFEIDCPKDYPQQIAKLSGEPMLFESVDMENLFFGKNKGGYWKQLNEQSSVLPSGKYYHLYAMHTSQSENTLIRTI